MIRRYDFFNQCPDIITLIPRLFFELLQLYKEFGFIQFDGLSNINHLIIGFLKSLFLHQKLFIELLTGT